MAVRFRLGAPYYRFDMQKHYNNTKIMYIFERKDGKFLVLQEDGGQSRAMWAEWTDDPFLSTRFESRQGYDHDHRWQHMAGEAVPRNVLVHTTTVITIQEK